MKHLQLTSIVFAVASLLSGCGGGGGTDSTAAGRDAFAQSVANVVASAPQDGDPSNVEGIAATAPDDSDADPVS